MHYLFLCKNEDVFELRQKYIPMYYLDQVYKKIRLIRSLKKFIFRYQDLVEKYSVSAETIINDGFSYSTALTTIIPNLSQYC